MTTTAPGWHQDPSTPAQLRYWDGTQWTEHVALLPSAAQPAPPIAVDPQPMQVGAPHAPADRHGPSSATHWLAPVGRSWQSVASGYMAFVCVAMGLFVALYAGTDSAGFVGALTAAAAGITLWFALWALLVARKGGHGRGRAIFGLIFGALGAVAALAAFSY